MPALPGNGRPGQWRLVRLAVRGERERGRPGWHLLWGWGARGGVCGEALFGQGVRRGVRGGALCGGCAQSRVWDLRGRRSPQRPPSLPAELCRVASGAGRTTVVVPGVTARGCPSLNKSAMPVCFPVAIPR